MSESVGDVLVAIDVGTSGARAVVFDLHGRPLVAIRKPYPIVSPRPGWAEQDARLWASASLAALRVALARIGPRATARAIGLTGQCPSIVAVDSAGRPLGPGLMYRDNRASREAAELRDAVGETAVRRITGHDPAAFHVAPKLLWLRRHEPEVFDRAARFLQPRDVALLALTGEEATDPTHAAGTLLYNLRGGHWSREIFSALGLDTALLPPILSSRSIVAELRPSVTRRLGLRAPIPVVVGGADSQTCALGSGVVAPGPVSEMAGSSTCLNAVVVEPLDEPQITHYPHVVPGVYTTETGINTTGSAVEWLGRLLYSRARREISNADFEMMDAEVAAADAGADGVAAVPVFGDGERTDTSLRAAFTGLSQRHGRAVLARALLEGTAFAIRAQLDLLRSAGGLALELRVSGGDTRLNSWNVIKADVIGVPVIRVPGDSATTGVAMLAGLGVGIYRDTAEAIAACVQLDAPIEPSTSHRSRYDEGYSRYLELVTSPVVRRAANPNDGLLE